MNKEKEELKVSKQKQIIDKALNKITSEGSNSYYSSTIDICRDVHDLFHQSNFLSFEEKEIVSDLDINDIQTLLSYNSNCC